MHVRDRSPAPDSTGLSTLREQHIIDSARLNALRTSIDEATTLVTDLDQQARKGDEVIKLQTAALGRLQGLQDAVKEHVLVMNALDIEIDRRTSDLQGSGRRTLINQFGKEFSSDGKRNGPTTDTTQEYAATPTIQMDSRYRL
jgi:hypothetical protein